MARGIPSVKRWLVKTTLTDGAVRRRFVLAPTRFLAELNDQAENSPSRLLELRLGVERRTFTVSRAPASDSV